MPLSADVAMRLERVTGTPARIWNRLEADYRSDLQRIRAKRELSGDVMRADDFPVAELVKRDFLPTQPADKLSRLEQLLAFFGVASVDAFDQVYLELACSFRTTQAFETKRGALTTWLRLGELAAQNVECGPYDRRQLEAALPRLRELTRDPIEAACKEVRGICAERGIAVFFVPEVPGSRASGVTRWLTPAKALIQLSLRYKSDDHLWFTFFHEIGHVLRHGKTDVWIEDRSSSSGPGDPQEAEADKFARDTLIPPRDARELPRLRSVDQVRAFANRLGIAPGIVVGRLQHDGIWPHSRGNQLKRQLSVSAMGDDSLP